MTLVDRVDDFGRTGWIVVTVLSFVVFWPLGLVVLGFLLGSGRMGCWHHSHNYGDRWQRRADRMQRGFDRMQRGMERMQAAAERWRGMYQSGRDDRPDNRPSAPSGNRAFDEYREETLRRLEDEQREFMEFLDRLRHAKDKAEFDQFMAERRRPAEPPPPPPHY